MHSSDTFPYKMARFLETSLEDEDVSFISRASSFEASKCSREFMVGERIALDTFMVVVFPCAYSLNNFWIEYF